MIELHLLLPLYQRFENPNVTARVIRCKVVTRLGYLIPSAESPENAFVEQQVES